MSVHLLKPLTKQRSQFDELLEMGFTAMHFATAIRMHAVLGTPIDDAILKQAETFMKYRTPVRQYVGGKPLPEEGAS